MKRLWFTLSIILLSLGCRQVTEISEAEKIEVIRDARQMLSDYYRDIKKSGLTAEFQYLDKSPDFFWVPPGYSTPISYDSVAAILNLGAPLYASVENSFDTLRIVPISRELATYTGKLRSTMTDTTGKVSTYALVETGLLIKRDDGWKLLSGQTSLLISN